MKQLAWLDFHRGEWRFITGNPWDPIRQWADEETALSDLAGEGWDISGLYRKRLPAERRTRQMFYGYGLTRTIHQKGLHST